MVFAYHVDDPERYGVVDFDEDKKAIGIEKKPNEPKSNYACTGFYSYDSAVTELAKPLKPTARGGLEITDPNRAYLKWDSLKAGFRHTRVDYRSSEFH